MITYTGRVMIMSEKTEDIEKEVLAYAVRILSRFLTLRQFNCLMEYEQHTVDTAMNIQQKLIGDTND